ncbi:MAG: VWA domain-containing protein, partial [Bacteroidetes bacterium]
MSPHHPHHSEYDNLTEAMLAFGQWLRKQGFQVGVQESMEALAAAAGGLIAEKKQFFFALKGLFCCSPEEAVRFEALFDHFWGAEKGAISQRIDRKNRSNFQKQSPASLVWMGMGQQQQDRQQESSKVSGAHAAERLRTTDFSKVKDIDSELLEELAMKLWQQMSFRLKRKMKAATRAGQIDLRRSIRAGMGQGGELIRLKYKKRQQRKQRLIILLDVSGSMDTYSFFLLRFVWALRAHFEMVDAYLFSTRLLRITDYLKAEELDVSLGMLSGVASHWSSGTKIGECLARFNQQHARQALSGHSTVIIVSDGLDTGKPELLAEELRKIKLRTRRLIWLNPLKGMKGYEPTARGMQA